MMKVGELRDRRIDQLSGGQKQRVALARAIAVRPRVLLMDEPLTALDAKLRDTLRMEIDSLLRHLGITSIYVTHDQAEAMALGDRIVVMEIAKVAQVGTPRQIYFQPQSRFVADFVGTINRIFCRIQAGHLLLPAGTIQLEDVPQVQGGEGEELEIFFRPEHAEVTEKGRGQLRSTVAAAFFMGDHTRLLIDWNGGEYLTIEAKGNQTFSKGQEVEIRIDPKALLTLKV
jgi:putative spermidine/putrescine transport system ATP-binding protein